MHAGYARYFTPPPTEKIDLTSVQKFAGTTNALPSDANTAVKSERSNYYDMGAAWQATPQLTLGIDGYYRQVRHLQDEGQFGNALVFSAFNYAQGRISGLELTAGYKDKGFSAYVNAGLTRARGKTVETGQFNFDPDELAVINAGYVHLDHEQKLTGSAGVAYRWGNGLGLAADALYGSGLRNGFANSEHLPSYTPAQPVGFLRARPRWLHRQGQRKAGPHQRLRSQLRAARRLGHRRRCAAVRAAADPDRGDQQDVLTPGGEPGPAERGSWRGSAAAG